MDSSSDEKPFAQQNALQKLKFRNIAVNNEQQQQQPNIMACSSSSRRQPKPKERIEPRGESRDLYLLPDFLTVLDLVSHKVSGSRQLAQDRLKRLQSNLKEQKKEKNQPVNKPSSRSQQHHQRNTYSSSSRSTNTKSSRSLTSFILNAWEKPQALIDASIRLKKANNTSSSSANERLRQLRVSLQQQQQQHHHHQYQKQKEVKGEQHPRRETNNNKPPQNVPQTIEPELEPEPMDWEDDDVSMAILKSLQREPGEQELPDRRIDHMYFILDTNVLIHNLSFVKDLPKLVMKGLAGSMIFIPYIVIKELDRLKAKHSDSEINRVAAIRAIHYLNSKFDESRDIQAQSALDEADHLIDVDSADDSILNCCLQLKEQVPHSMLLTNDNNLRLKANATSIRVSCKSDLMSEYPDIFDS